VLDGRHKSGLWRWKSHGAIYTGTYLKSSDGEANLFECELCDASTMINCWAVLAMLSYDTLIISASTLGTPCIAKTVLLRHITTSLVELLVYRNMIY
jgi:hypothetical protein